MRIKDEWHIWDLSEKMPQELHVSFSDEFHNRFFNVAISMAGGQRALAREIEEYPSRISMWYHKNRRPPIAAIKKIYNFINQNDKKVLDLTDIEKNIVEISIPGTVDPLSIKFPLHNFDIELIKIVAHILGDGGITKKHDIFYSNTEKILIDEFCNSIKKRFCCNPRKYKWFGKTQVWFPRLIGYILTVMYGEFAYAKNPKLVPAQIMNAPDKIKSILLKHFYSDEGSICGYSIQLYQGKNNIKLLKQMQRLVAELGLRPSKIICVKKNHIIADPQTGKEYEAKPVYTFGITSYHDIKKFRDQIGFVAGINKTKKIARLLDSYKLIRRRDGETKRLLIKLAERKSYSVTELANKLNISKRSIYNHIDNLPSNFKLKNGQLTKVIC